MAFPLRIGARLMSTGLYLQKTGSGVISGASGGFGGTARVSLAPAVGEFWAVSLVTVSTQPFAVTQPLNANIAAGDVPLQPYCALFRGAVGQTQQIQFVDDTYSGRGDATSILSGTVIQYGEALTAVWTTPNDSFSVFNTAVMTVYGRSYSSLQELQSELSPIPGAKFSGTSANALEWNYGGSLAPTPIALIDNTGLFLVTAGLVELIDIVFQVNTSAVASNRSIGVQVLHPNGDTTLAMSFGTAFHQPSQNIVYSFATDGPAYAVLPVGASTGNYANSLPARCVLPSNAAVLLRASNAQAGDTIRDVSIAYRQFGKVSKASFV